MAKGWLQVSIEAVFAQDLSRDDHCCLCWRCRLHRRVQDMPLSQRSAGSCLGLQGCCHSRVLRLWVAVILSAGLKPALMLAGSQQAH